MLTRVRSPDHSRRFTELAEVRLAREVQKDGVVYPVGTRGVVVWCYPDGKAYEVELIDPQPTVISIMDHDLI